MTKDPIRESNMRKRLNLLLTICILAAGFLTACGETTPPETSVSYPTVASTLESSAHEPGGPGKVSVSTSESQETDEDKGGSSTGTSTETSTETSAGTSTAVSSETSGSGSDETVEAVSLRFTIINLCGADIGLLSTLDPVSFEQIDIGGLDADGVMSFSLSWPAEGNYFYLAIYNVNGELVCATENDISAALSLAKANSSASVKIMLSLSDAGEVLTDVEFE